MMQTKLQLKPLTSFLKILLAFNHGLPLSSDQINYLRRYHTQISNSQIDSICKYYGILKEPEKTLPPKARSLSLISINDFKDRITKGLKEASSYQTQIDAKQWLQFRMLLMKDLIYFHGNHNLTGAPFFPGGVAHVVYFQWGNFFGIALQEEVLGVTATDGNILMYFEEKQDRTLQEFVREQNQQSVLHTSHPHFTPSHIRKSEAEIDEEQEAAQSKHSP